MPTDDLTGELLASVSRTFAVSIRVLPAALREPMGVAYLLARTSDTIADSAGVAAAVRTRRLDDFGTLLEAGTDPALVTAIQADIQPAPPGERALLAALPRVLDRFAALPPPDRQETLDLLATIVAGQRSDLLAFADPGHVAALPDARALEAYTQAVAGSVGEWWTRTCGRHFRHYSERAESELVPLGAALGKALQLVNILRDMPTDLRAGRCYLPADELRAAGTAAARLRDDPVSAQPVFAAWSARARGLLRDGRDYIRAVRPWRARFACYVPWRLAEQTLDLMQRRPPLATVERVKVSRSAVRGTMLRACAVAIGDWPLG
jgi:farnesyl-diphosphate farnesyltransferase